MAREGPDPKAVEALEHWRALQVAPRDDMAHGDEQRGDPVHAGAAHPHDMEVELAAVEVRQLLAGPFSWCLRRHLRLPPHRCLLRARAASGEHALQPAAPPPRPPPGARAP